MENMEEKLYAYKLRTEEYKPFVESIGSANFNADYISWSVCWDKLKELYPLARHEWVTYNYDGKPASGLLQPDGTVIVHCKITYETEDGDKFSHDEYLAVRNNRNQAVQNPDSAQLENTYRRALAKGVSTLTGFGIELWMNEDIIELQAYRPETHHNGVRPQPGGATVDQTVKLDALMRDRNCTPTDKTRIKTLKENGWKDLSESQATILIADVKAGITNNKPVTKTRIGQVTKLIESSSMEDDKKKSTISWLDGKSNMEVDALMSKLKETGVINAV